jgi:putative transposase
MVKQWWLKIPLRFKNVTLDQFQIMPNHFHGIIVINDEMCHGQYVGVGFPDPNGLSLNDHGRGNRAPTLGQMVAYFKYQSTKQINQLRKTPGQRLWQRNYYEHVIRTENDLNKIREYIKINPQIWGRDRNNPKNW